MQKIIIAIAAIVFAFSTSMVARPAHAGMKGKIAVGLAIGAMAVMANQHRMQRQRAAKKRYYARKKAQKKTYVAKKKVSQPKPQYVAEIEPEDVPLPEQKVATDVVTENSSITTAALTDTDRVSEDATDVNDEAIEDADEVSTNATDAANDTTAVGSLGCKKFFPSVGMTLSVPCETSNTQ